MIKYLIQNTAATAELDWQTPIECDNEIAMIRVQSDIENDDGIGIIEYDDPDEPALRAGDNVQAYRKTNEADAIAHAADLVAAGYTAEAEQIGGHWYVSVVMQPSTAILRTASGDTSHVTLAAAIAAAPASKFEIFDIPQPDGVGVQSVCVRRFPSLLKADYDSESPTYTAGGTLVFSQANGYARDEPNRW